MVIGSELSQGNCLTELLFADSDQVELDGCLRDGFFTDEYVLKLVESSKTIRQQVLARCAG
jgi:hypothetical protein